MFVHSADWGRNEIAKCEHIILENESRRTTFYKRANRVIFWSGVEDDVSVRTGDRPVTQADKPIANN